MKAVRQIFAPDHVLFLAACALFLFYLVYSAPHRVHHFFDPNGRDACVTFMLAKSCHLESTSAISLPFSQVAFGGIALFLEASIPHRPPSAFWQRAPPLV